MKLLNSAAVSWKTTALGVLVFVEALIVNLIAIMDTDPNTVADWNLVIIAGTAMIGLIMARDANKSSEDQQLK